MKSAAALTLASAVTSELMFSGYLEGSGNNKEVTIYNSGCADIDLSEYHVRLYSNKNTDKNDPNKEIKFPEGTTLWPPVKSS